MLSTGTIIEAYRKDKHIVDGLYIREVQELTEEQIVAILEGAQGRDIIIDQLEDAMDGQAWKYDGEIAKDFDFSKYL